MVRTYIRKTEKGAGYAYTAEDLRLAVDDVKNGNKSFRGASAAYNIPKSTLIHHVKGTRGAKGRIADGSKGGGGVKSYLPSAVEEEIANCLKILDRNGFGLSRIEVLDLVELYIKKNNIQTRFKNKRPSADWFIGFRKRHRLSVKKAQSVEHVRTDQTNPWIVYDYFQKLTKVVQNLELNGKPHLIYNCDETSFCHDPSKTKTVGAINSRSFRKTSSSGRENTTALLCCSASGQMLPLLCVFKGKSVMQNWLEAGLITETAVSVTERGWMETILFHNWFRDVFLKNIGPERPVLLIYDGHVTHISIELIKLAQENNVTIMKLPPHTTHVLQPLDVAVFKGLKTKWDQELCKWQRKNPRKKIPKSEFILLLSKIAKEIPYASIVNGFSTTGIYDPEIQGPNKDAIPLSVFKATDLKRYNEQLQCSKPSEETEGSGMELEVTANEEESEKTSNEENPNNKSQERKQTEGNEGEEDGKSSEEPYNNNHIPDERAEDLAVASTSHDETSSIRPQTFEELVLDILKTNEDPNKTNTSKRRRIVTQCEIITDAEFLKKKEEEENRKQELLKKKKEAALKREEKKKKQNTKIPAVDDDASEISDAYSLRESDEDPMSFSEDEKENTSLYDCGDFCIVKVHGKTATSYRHYVAKILDIYEDSFDGRFYQRHNQTMKFLETEEESNISKADFVLKLSKPIECSSARYKGMITFPDDVSDITNIC